MDEGELDKDLIAAALEYHRHPTQGRHLPGPRPRPRTEQGTLHAASATADGRPPRTDTAPARYRKRYPTVKPSMSGCAAKEPASDCSSVTSESSFIQRTAASSETCSPI